MKLEYYRKNVYGNDRLYIHGAVVAANVWILTGQKTVSEKHLTALRALGVETEEILQPRG